MNRIKFNPNILKGAIFDVDGVLLETEYFQWQGWIEVLKPFDKTLPKQKYFKYAGKQGPIIEFELLNDLNLKLDKNYLLSKKEALVVEWFHSQPIHLMPYAMEALSFFQEKNIKLATATGSPRNEVLLKLKKTGLFPLFQNIVSGSDIKRGKPFPDTYAAAAKALTLNPDTCLAFEDTQYGVESAKSAGLFCFAIPNEFSHKQDFSKADGVFKNLQDAITWINQKN